MAACRRVNVNMLWQQTLNQPLVTTSWNNLKTCVTFWPNLGWCSTSLTRTEARTALMTSDFHYEPAVGSNVHPGWDRGCSGSAAPFGQECASSQRIHWEMMFSGLLFALALKSSGHFSFSPLLLGTSHVGAVLASSCHGFPLLPSSPHGPVSHWAAPWESSCSSAQTLHYSSGPDLLVQVCSWFEMCVKSLSSFMSHPCGLEQAGLS